MSLRSNQQAVRQVRFVSAVAATLAALAVTTTDAALVNIGEASIFASSNVGNAAGLAFHPNGDLWFNDRDADVVRRVTVGSTVPANVFATPDRPRAVVFSSGANPTHLFFALQTAGEVRAVETSNYDSTQTLVASGMALPISLDLIQSSNRVVIADWAIDATSTVQSSSIAQAGSSTTEFTGTRAYGVAVKQDTDAIYVGHATYISETNGAVGTPVVGSATNGFADDTGTSATLSQVKCMRFTPDNNYLYFVDDNKVRRVTWSNMQVNTVLNDANSQSVTPSTTSYLASSEWYRQMAFDPLSGDMYIGSTGSIRAPTRIWKVDLPTAAPTNPAPPPQVPSVVRDMATFSEILAYGGSQRQVTFGRRDLWEQGLVDDVGAFFPWNATPNASGLNRSDSDPVRTELRFQGLTLDPTDEPATIVIRIGQWVADFFDVSHQASPAVSDGVQHQLRDPALTVSVENCTFHNVLLVIDLRTLDEYGDGVFPSIPPLVRVVMVNSTLRSSNFFVLGPGGPSATHYGPRVQRDHDDVPGVRVALDFRMHNVTITAQPFTALAPRVRLRFGDMAANDSLPFFPHRGASAANPPNWYQERTWPLGLGEQSNPTSSLRMSSALIFAQSRVGGSNSTVDIRNSVLESYEGYAMQFLLGVDIRDGALFSVQHSALRCVESDVNRGLSSPTCYAFGAIDHAFSNAVPQSLLIAHGSAVVFNRTVFEATGSDSPYATAGVVAFYAAPVLLVDRAVWLFDDCDFVSTRDNVGANAIFLRWLDGVADGSRMIVTRSRATTLRSSSKKFAVVFKQRRVPVVNASALLFSNNAFAAGIHFENSVSVREDSALAISGNTFDLARSAATHAVLFHGVDSVLVNESSQLLVEGNNVTSSGAGLLVLEHPASVTIPGKLWILGGSAFVVAENTCRNCGVWIEWRLIGSGRPGIVIERGSALVVARNQIEQTEPGTAPSAGMPTNTISAPPNPWQLTDTEVIERDVERAESRNESTGDSRNIRHLVAPVVFVWNVRVDLDAIDAVTSFFVAEGTQAHAPVAVVTQCNRHTTATGGALLLPFDVPVQGHSRTVNVSDCQLCYWQSAGLAPFVASTSVDGGFRRCATASAPSANRFDDHTFALPTFVRQIVPAAMLAETSDVTADGCICECVEPRASISGLALPLSRERGCRVDIPAAVAWLTLHPRGAFPTPDDDNRRRKMSTTQTARTLATPSASTSSVATHSAAVTFSTSLTRRHTRNVPVEPPVVTEPPSPRDESPITPSVTQLPTAVPVEEEGPQSTSATETVSLQSVIDTSADLRPADARVRALGLSPTAADTITATAYGSSAVAAVVSPTMGSKATSAGRVARIATCGAYAGELGGGDDEWPEPVTFLWLVFPVASGATSDEDDGDSGGRLTDAEVEALDRGVGAVLVSVGLNAATALLVYGVARRRRQQQPPGDASVWWETAAVASYTVAATYLAPSVTSVAVTLLRYAPAASSAVLWAAGAGGLVVCALAATPLVRLLTAVRVFTSGGDEATATATAEDSSSGAAAPRPMMTSVAVWKRVLSSAWDGVRDPTLAAHRLCVLEDLAAAHAIAALEGARPTSVAGCRAVGGAMVLVAALHVAYLAVVRPYAAAVERVGMLVLGALQLGVGVAAAAVLFTSSSSGDDSEGGGGDGDSGADVALALLQLAYDGAVFAVAGLLAVAECRSRSAGPARDDAAADADAPLLLAPPLPQPVIGSDRQPDDGPIKPKRDATAKTSQLGRDGEHQQRQNPLRDVPV